MSGVESLLSRVAIGRPITLQAALRDISPPESVLDLKVVLVRIVITVALGMCLQWVNTLL